MRVTKFSEANSPPGPAQDRRGEDRVVGRIADQAAADQAASDRASSGTATVSSTHQSAFGRRPSGVSNGPPQRSGVWVINAAFLTEIKDSCIEATELRQHVEDRLRSPILYHRDARELCETLERWRDALAMLFALEQTYGYVELPDDRLDAEDHLHRLHFEKHFDADQCCGVGQNVGVAMHTPLDHRIEPSLPSLMPPSCLLKDHARLYTRIQVIIDDLENAIAGGIDPPRLARVCSAIYQFLEDIDNHDDQERRWTELSAC